MSGFCRQSLLCYAYSFINAYEYGFHRKYKDCSEGEDTLSPNKSINLSVPEQNFWLSWFSVNIYMYLFIMKVVQMKSVGLFPCQY